MTATRSLNADGWGERLRGGIHDRPCRGDRRRGPGDGAERTTRVESRDGRRRPSPARSDGYDSQNRRRAKACPADEGHHRAQTPRTGIRADFQRCQRRNRHPRSGDNRGVGCQPDVRQAARLRERRRGSRTGIQRVSRACSYLVLLP